MPTILMVVTLQRIPSILSVAKMCLKKIKKEIMVAIKNFSEVIIFLVQVFLINNNLCSTTKLW